MNFIRRDIQLNVSCRGLFDVWRGDLVGEVALCLDVLPSCSLGSVSPERHITRLNFTLMPHRRVIWWLNLWGKGLSQSRVYCIHPEGFMSNLRLTSCVVWPSGSCNLASSVHGQCSLTAGGVSVSSLQGRGSVRWKHWPGPRSRCWGGGTWRSRASEKGTACRCAWSDKDGGGGRGGRLEYLVMEVIRARQRYSILSTPDSRHHARRILKKQRHIPPGCHHSGRTDDKVSGNCDRRRSQRNMLIPRNMEQRLSWFHVCGIQAHISVSAAKSNEKKTKKNMRSDKRSFPV